MVNNGCNEVCFLFQVGDFYEAIGIDACILVEYAGLNPFGGLRSDSIPRAGCPVVVWVIVLRLYFCIDLYSNNFCGISKKRKI